METNKKTMSGISFGKLNIAKDTRIPVLTMLVLLAVMFCGIRTHAANVGQTGTTGETNLTGVSLTIYSELKDGVQKIASGETSSSVVTMTASYTYAELGVSDFSGAREWFLNAYDVDEIFQCLVFDCPYDLYWCDKTSGVSTNTSYSYNSTKMDLTLTWTFAVSEDYQGSSANTVKASKVAAAVEAAETAQAIVDKYESKTDREKLIAYRDEICALVSYEDDYASYSYGDIQQLIYVFDGDTSTKVVCEGYSKAFQYLCDLSNFDNAVCYTVDGTMTGGTGAGEHMWNLVCLDGVNYMVDVTNSDDGTVGEDGGLFLVCADDATSSSATGYSFSVSGKTISYTYNSKTTTLYTSSVRTLGTNEVFSASEKCSVSSVSNVTGGLKVTWGKVSGATGYYVYRKVSGGSYSLVKTITSGSTVNWSDTSSTLTSGKDYNYKVVAYCKTSDGTIQTGTAGTAKTCKYLAGGVVSSVANTTTGQKVTWTKVTGANGYYVYRKISGGSYSLVKTITSGSTVTWSDTSTHTSGKDYNYKVVPYFKSSSGAYTVGVAKTTKTAKFLTAGKISSFANTSSGLTVNWSKVTGASGYYVYRKTSSATSYTLVKTITSGSTVSYTDTAVKNNNNTSYTYYVQPYFKSSSGAITKASYTTRTTYRLATPSISSLTNSSSKKMTVKWGTKSGVTGYKIQYSTSSSFASGNTTVTVTGASSASKVISSLTKGKTYYVRIRTYKTVNGVTYYSGWSTVKSVKISK